MQSGLVCILSMVSDFFAGIKVIHKGLAMDHMRPVCLFANVVDVPCSHKRGDMETDNRQINRQKSDLVRYRGLAKKTIISQGVEIGLFRV